MTERATKTAGSQRPPAAGRFSDAVKRLLLLCSLLRSLFRGCLSRCSSCFLRGLLWCSFLCHSTFLHTKLNLSGRPAKALPGLKINRTTTDQKHQIIKVPLTRMMQIPFNTDDRLEVAVRQVLRHVHPVPGVSVLNQNYFDQHSVLRF